jgi:hypothetical protein
MFRCKWRVVGRIYISIQTHWELHYTLTYKLMCFFYLFKNYPRARRTLGRRNPFVVRLIEFSMLNIFFGLSACLTGNGDVTYSQAHAGY